MFIIDPLFHQLSTMFWSPSADSTANVVVLRKGFSRLTQDIYHLPIEINDNGLPAMSSTNTLTIRVCSCDSKNTILSCNVEPYVLPAGLSTGALIAILACIVILLGKDLIFGTFLPLELYLFLCWAENAPMNGTKQASLKRSQSVFCIFTVIVHVVSDTYNLVEERHVDIQLQLSVMCAQRAKQQWNWLNCPRSNYINIPQY